MSILVNQSKQVKGNSTDLNDQEIHSIHDQSIVSTLCYENNNNNNMEIL